MKWLRYRFTTEDSDYRPMVFPPPGPYWCSGYDSSDRPIVIAYIPNDPKGDPHPDAILMSFWPDATLDDGTPQSFDEITFTDRFPKPEWWDG